MNHHWHDGPRSTDAAVDHACVVLGYDRATIFTKTATGRLAMGPGKSFVRARERVWARVRATVLRTGHRPSFPEIAEACGMKGSHSGIVQALVRAGGSQTLWAKRLTPQRGGDSLVQRRR